MGFVINLRANSQISPPKIKQLCSWQSQCLVDQALNWKLKLSYIS